jgi:peptidoglycan hydrolase-like protein with peptidoglycan-binding domain
MHARIAASARESEVGTHIKTSAMKRTVIIAIAFVVAASLRADQTIQSVQQALKDQGFYYGSVTGEKNAETTAAVRRYQIRNGLQVTGEVNSEILQSLNLSGKSTAVASSQPSSKPAVTQSNSSRPDGNASIVGNPPLRPPDQPDRRFDSQQSFTEPDKSAPRRVSKREVIAEVQRQLTNQGYYRERIDGRYGRRTAYALREFQFASGVPPSGRLDMTTLNALGLSDANLAYLQPEPRSREAWVSVTKFKHGKWKVKWKKVHGDERDEYTHENQDENGGAWWQGEDGD